MTVRSLVERSFESALWACRYAVLVAVIASLLIALGMFYSTTVDSVYHLRKVLRYAATSEQVPTNEVKSFAEPGKSTGDHAATTRGRDSTHERDRSAMIANVVEAIDGYLLATVMLIFAFGLYELFISRIEISEGRGRAAKILLIHSLDDLKHRLGQVILLILVVKYFEHALRLDYETAESQLWLALGILLVASALFLTHRRHAQVTEPEAGEGT